MSSYLCGAFRGIRANTMTAEPERPVISILVVDDDEATLNLLGTFLRRNGYRVLIPPRQASF